MARALAYSVLLPPRYVDLRIWVRSLFSLATKASVEPPKVTCAEGSEGSEEIPGKGLVEVFEEEVSPAT
jgi:hypothetical protein